TVEITLVGERQAQVGHEFVYRGPQPECRPCKVRAACLNQALGQRYRIKRVRDVTHPCLLNEERARVVEVELAPPEASLPSRAAIEGAVLSYEKIVCSNAACPNFRLCHPPVTEPGLRVRVEGVDTERVAGPEGRGARARGEQREPGRDLGGRPIVRDVRMLERGLPELPALPPARDGAGHAGPGARRRSRAGGRAGSSGRPRSSIRSSRTIGRPPRSRRGSGGSPRAGPTRPRRPEPAPRSGDRGGSRRGPS